ncbi:MAG: hypothetical protein DMG49_02625 [Acidobacteria bacterium]|nr:MAG: hypothetical protein DMG49_02625 [Acidobacteriota bacterium]
MFHLHTMQIHGHVKLGNYVFAEQDPTFTLHVEEFDGKHVRGMLELFFREKQRGGLLLLRSPPFHNRSHAFQFTNVQRGHHAQNVEI